MMSPTLAHSGPQMIVSPAVEALADALRIHPPNAPRRGLDLDADRAPALLSFARHRAIELPWESLVPPPVSRRSSVAAEALRASIENSWGVQRGAADVWPVIQNFVLTANEGESKFVARWFVQRTYPNILGIKDEVVPAGAVVLSDRAGRRFYWLRSDEGPLDFQNAYDAAWEAASSAVRVFPSTDLPEPPTGPPFIELALPASSFDWASVLKPGSPWPQPTKPIKVPPIATAHGSYAADVEAVRTELEASWGLGIPAAILAKQVSRAAGQDLVRLDEARLRTLVPVSGKSAATVEANAVIPLADQEWVIAADGRFYHVVFRSGVNPGAVDLTDPVQYRRAWDEQIERLEQVGRRTALPFSHFESVDLRPQVILEEYKRFDLERDLASKFSLVGDAVGKRISDSVELSVAELDVLAEKYRSIKARMNWVDASRLTLKERASRLGYVLPLAPNEEFRERPNPANNEPLAPGKLYQRFVNYGSYVVSETFLKYELAIFGHLLFREYETRQYTVYRHFLDAVEIKPEREPWVTKMAELTALGFECHRFALADAGYVSDEGVPLVQMMRRAQRDEEYRRRLAVFIPVYEQRLSQGLVQVSWDVIVRPMPGYAPAVFPSLYVEEALSYRTQWRGVEAGELLHSVPLAPGEERTVSISRSIKQTTERVDSIVSVLDVTQAQSFELNDAMENVARRENTSTTSSNWNVNAGGSFGPFSASGGGGGSTTQTSKDFAESVRRTATKAARELKAQNRQEVRSSTTTSTAVTSEESTTSRISNINQGRTLNLLFYELNNVFDAGVFLDDLEFVYTPSVPLIAGTRLLNPTKMRFGDLRAIVDAIGSDPAFFATVPADREAVRRAALDRVMETILSEYVAPPAEDKSVTRLSTTRSSHALQMEAMPQLFSAEAADKTEEAENGEAAEPTLDEEIGKALQILARMTRTNAPIVPHTLVTPAPAVYVDAVVGAMPATEPYSDEMRNRELALRTAQALDRAADAELKHARALALLHGHSADEGRYELKAPVILGVTIKKRELTVTLSEELPPGSWTAVVNDTEALAIPPASSGTTIAVPLVGAAITEDTVITRLQIVERLTQVYVDYRPD
ncbi:MAG TPA: hypothetical protein VF846_19290 [Thermoanaerobaculia bacterium]|jgi:hypothetical protein